MWVPMTRFGGESSTRGSRAVRRTSASADTPSPGAMAPPRYSPAAEITSKVMAVPASTTMAAVPKSRWTATVFAMRSAPVSSGVSTARRIPRAVRWVNSNRRWPKCRSATTRRVSVTVGATLAAATPLTRSGVTGTPARSASRSAPSSSGSRSGAVATRQSRTQRSPSWRPTAVLVFPTSKTRSMAAECYRRAPVAPLPTAVGPGREPAILRAP